MLVHISLEKSSKAPDDSQAAPVGFWHYALKAESLQIEFADETLDEPTTARKANDHRHRSYWCLYLSGCNKISIEGCVRYESRRMRRKQAVMKQKEMMKAGITDINGITVENDGVDGAKPKLSSAG
jgi:hypothetical protein